jgi:hypothetical protein
MESRFAERARLIRQILHPEQEGGQPAAGPADESGEGSRAPGGEREGTADKGKTE